MQIFNQFQKSEQQRHCLIRVRFVCMLYVPNLLFIRRAFANVQRIPNVNGIHEYTFTLRNFQ